MPNLVSNPITAEQLLRARQLFEEALAVEGPARDEVLDRGCGSDYALRSVVQEMIAADKRENPLLDGSLVPSESFVSADLPPNAKIGPYLIRRALAAGGMGTVYLAELPGKCPPELFAIKVIRWVSPDLLRRFQQEQSILRRLEHPNIARFIDAGLTEQGSPYFVMEYIDGQPIHAYCEDGQLSVNDRIALSREVCSAVRYLHQNLVIHRDLKPANVLVTAAGQVNLVDFGISKLLQSSDRSTTNTSVGLMTPDYASPEQIRGGAISTLTDVYALGVLLYELLTGAKPFSSANGELQETLRRICEEEPAKPSIAAAMNRSVVGDMDPNRLRGELDNIVLKALEKEPQRRYGSVEQLDEDLRRYQAGLPVLAQGDSIPYRIRKFVIRYKGPVAAGCVMLALLIGGIVATTIEARVAHRAAMEADHHAREVDRQKAIADTQSHIAQQERSRAERETVEALREKQNAQRRLSELQRLTRSATEIYSSARSSSASPEAEMIARFAQDSLTALQGEKTLRPEQLQLLDATKADVRSYQLATDDTWIIPKGWSARETKPHQYRVGLDQNVRHSGMSSLFLRSLRPNPAGSVFVFQLIGAGNYSGKRIKLEGYLRPQRVVAQARLGLMLLANGGETLSYEDVTVSGTSSWERYAITMDVPSKCTSIQAFVQLSSAGTLWADDFRFDVVPLSVPLTRRTQPLNLDFSTR